MRLGKYFEVGKRMKQVRTNAGISQRDMAARLSLKNSAYSNYENGYSEPTVETILKFCDMLGTTLNDLLGVKITSNKSIATELLQYKERERRWIERETRERPDLEAWKTSAVASLLELADGDNFIKTFCLYEKVRKISFLESWEKIFAFYDREILEELFLEDINAFYALEEEKFSSFSEVMEKICPKEAFVIFIEREMDIRPGMLPGNLILDMLDKLSLLFQNE